MALPPLPPLSAVLQALSGDTTASHVKRPLSSRRGVQAIPPAGVRDGRKSAAQGLRARLKVACSRADWSASKALRLLVEVALLREMGETMQLDPEFGDLVERTSRAIEMEEGCAQLVRESFEQLTALGRAQAER